MLFRIKKYFSPIVVLTAIVALFISLYFLQKPKEIKRNLAALQGDCDTDGDVDIIDFQLLSNTFGKTSGQTGYDGRCDFNTSNSVDLLDFQILSNNFGKTGTTNTPTTRLTNAPTATLASTPTAIVTSPPLPTIGSSGGYNFGPYRPGLTLIEIQAWWNPIPDDLKGFGHVHILCWWPLGKRVKAVFPDGVIRTDCRITLHNNPNTINRLLINLAEPDVVIKTIPTGELKCPYDGVNQTNCSWNIPVTLDTNSWPVGWRHLRIKAVQNTVDGRIWFTSSEIPVLIDGSTTAGSLPGCRADLANNTSCLRGKSWYEGLDYENVEITNVPTAPVKKGTILKHHIRLIVGTVLSLNAFLDRSHFIPAVGPWPQENPLNGPDLSQTNNSGYDVTIDTSNLSLGWHSFAARATSTGTLNSSCAGKCSYTVTNPNHQTGVAKYWFYLVP
jgi:hypothetical protein